MSCTTARFFVDDSDSILKITYICLFSRPISGIICYLKPVLENVEKEQRERDREKCIL
jgi:hypothetical protein